jgi:phage-related protein
MSTALPLPDKISPESTKQTAFRDITNQFGDGYFQSAPDGLNSQIDAWNIIWMNVTEADKTTIITALNIEGTWGILTWTPFDEASVKKFRMEKPGYSFRYSRTAPGTRRYIIECKLTQRFDL